MKEASPQRQNLIIVIEEKETKWSF